MVMSTAVDIHAQHYRIIQSKVTAGMGFTRLNKGTPVGDSGWMLSLDLGVDLEVGEKFVVATNSWIDEYGHGDTVTEAIDDLLDSLVEFKESLEKQSTTSVLSQELTDSLEKLQTLLVGQVN